MILTALAVGWYIDRTSNHYAYNVMQFRRMIDAKHQAKRELIQCQLKLEELRALK